jgi:hypothetical protein
MIDLPKKGLQCWVSIVTVSVIGLVEPAVVIPAPPLPDTDTPSPAPAVPIIDTISPAPARPITKPPQPPVMFTILPVDLIPPRISSPQASLPMILIVGAGCPTYSRTTVVSAAVTDEGGVSSVTARWSIGGEAGEVSMSPAGRGTYQAVIGPVNSVGQMMITISAADTAGNTAKAGPVVVQVLTCIE